LEEADGYDDLARGFETDLINTVRAAGRDNLAEQIITNRRLAAKTHIAMRANNSARGVVEADEYGRVSRKNPRLLDGDAKLIADTYNARQQQEFHLGTMLSRPVMLAEKGAGALERTRFGQMLSRNTPSWHEYPDLKSAASSFLINREGREEPLPIKPKSPKERVERAVSEAVKKYIGLSK
jgi:hypothetical protein